MNNINTINQKIGRYRWTICFIIFVATTVNYLDRQVLSLLAPDLSKLFGWSNTDYANITAIFQFVYAISMLFAGRLIDKLGTKTGYTLAIIIWSLGAMMHTYAIPMGELLNHVFALVGIAAVPVSIAGFMLARTLLALGEAGNFPAAIKTTAEYFPAQERSLATGIFNSGANVGAMLAPLLVPWIALHWGWESSFMIIGGIGILWVFFWQHYYEKPEQQKRLSQAEFDYIHRHDNETSAKPLQDSAEFSWVKLLTYRQTWAFAFGKFMTDGVWWFYLFWLPKYLETQFGISNTEIMLPLTLIYSMTMISSIAGGWLPNYFIAKGINFYVSRLRAMLIIACFPLCVLFAQPLGHLSYWIPVLLIGVGASAHQAWSCNLYTTVSDMFPKKSVASVIGIGSMAGGAGSIIISKLGGWIFDYYEPLGKIYLGYSIMFAICALAYLIALAVIFMLAPKHKPITDL